MWVKGVTILVLATLVCGCGQAVSESPPNSPQPKKELSDVQKQLPGTNTYGALPTSPPPASVAKIQVLFQAEISKGIPAEKFSKFDIKPYDTIIKGSGNQNKKSLPTEKYSMFLVHSHLKLISNNCSGKQGYEGWIAADEALILNYNGPPHLQAFVRPYRVSICEKDGGLDYQIVELGTVFTSASKVKLSDLATNPQGISASGSLPTTPAPEEVAEIQSKFQNLLKKGIPEQAFIKFDVKPDQSVDSSVNGRKASQHENGNHKMFLVKSHLVKASNSSCSSGTSYEAWIAAQPQLSFQVTEPAIQTMFARPYRVRICEKNGMLDYEIVEIGESLSP